MLQPLNAPSGDFRAMRLQEIRTVAVLSLGFGLVGIDRFLISTLYPVIARDLKLSYGDIGTITGVLAIAWGLSALFMGNMSDRVGRRRVLTISLVVFSLLIGASGLATGLLSLIAVRIVMGFADGAYTPASIAGTLAASPLKRRGLNIGIQQMMMPLFGLGLAPLMVAGVLRYMDWRLVFLLFVAPGLALALAVWKVLARDETDPTSSTATVGRWSDWRGVLAYSNVRVAAVLMLCWLTCLVTTSAFMPNYLVDHLNLPLDRMGTVMSAIGLGATAGTLILPWLSDRLGRKPVMLVSAAGTFISLVLLLNARAVVSVLFGGLFMVHFFNNALITLTVGPLCSEAVPLRLMATASGLVIAAGELFGGGLAPVLVGQVAQRFGIDQVLWLPIAMIGVGFLLCTAITDIERGPPRTAAGRGELAIMSDKVIISCTITGAMHTPTMSDALPITPAQIAEQSIAAAEAGAAVIHLHARSPADGEPTGSPEVYLQFLPQIHAQTDAVINLTTGGSPTMSVADRLAAGARFKPELCSLNMGSMNFAIFPAAKRIKEWKYAWEEDYVRNSDDFIFRNTFRDIAYILETMSDSGTKFEHECYDVGHLYTLAHFIDRGLVKPPFFVQLIFGILGGIGADHDNLTFMKQTADRLFGAGSFQWSVMAAGRHQMPFVTQAALLGGNVRVGLEDSIFIERGKLAESNAEQVAKIVRILKEMGRQPATPTEARALFGLKGQAKVHL